MKSNRNLSRTVVRKQNGRMTTYEDGILEFKPTVTEGKKIYTFVNSPLPGAVLQKSENIYKISVSTPITTPHPARVLRAYFEAAVAPIENIN